MCSTRVNANYHFDHIIATENVIATPNVTLIPHNDQVVLQGDKLRMRCKTEAVTYGVSLTWFHGRRDVNKNKPAGVRVYNETLPNGCVLYSVVFKNCLQIN